MKTNRVYLILPILIFISNLLFAQKVTVSQEINVKNNIAYDIFPNVEGQILFYHDRGTEHFLEVFDQNLRYKWDRQLDFEKKNITILGLAATDTLLNIFYQYRDEGKIYTKVKSYDSNAASLDTSVTLFVQEFQFIKKPRFTTSEDKSKICLFWEEDRNIHLVVVDNHTKTILVKDFMNFKEFNFRTDFTKLTVANDGQVFVLGKRASSWKKVDPNKLMLAHLVAKNQHNIYFYTVSEFEITQVLMVYDEYNNKLALGGLLSKGDEEASVGYFCQSYDLNQNNENYTINHHTFTLEFIGDILGKKVTKIKEIRNLYIQDLILRKDGGIVMIAEMKKEYIRRTNAGPTGRFGDFYSSRGFVDFYHEDLILFSNDLNGVEFWKKILYKKQFSQDDEGIYSSYFLFRTPSRIKLMYNDEIKNSNTVSEYNLDALGNFERKSVLSTEYQNLKLRFRDAIQIGSTSLIVPSEKSLKINLVKIEY